MKSTTQIQKMNEIKVAKANYKKALRNKELYKEKRDQLINSIVTNPTPKWGSLKVIITPIN